MQCAVSVRVNVVSAVSVSSNMLFCHAPGDILTYRDKDIMGECTAVATLMFEFTKQSINKGILAYSTRNYNE